MAKDINVSIFVGRSTRDADITKSRTGMTICKFSIAVNGWKEGDVSFFDCVMFDKFAEKVGPYITKGKKLAITAEAKQNRWTDETTQKGRSRVEFTVKDLNLLGGGDKANETEQTFKSELTEFEEDIPF